MKPEEIIIEPLITEKSTAGKGEGKYVFRVHPQASKIEIKKAIQEVFKVKVEAVNTGKIPGKRRTLGRSVGYTSCGKKAYITLKSGEKIEKLEV